MVRLRRVAIPLLGGLLMAGCGATGGSPSPPATATVEVVKASFPTNQQVSRRSYLELTVRNPSDQPLPQVAVAIRSFYYHSNYPHLADPNRPIWIVDEGPGPKPPIPVETVPFDPPGGAVTDDASQWALGPLQPGETKTFRFALTPVKPGRQQLGYAVIPARPGRPGPAALGRAVEGRFSTVIEPAPPKRYVNPATGAVELGRLPVQSGP